MTLSRVLLAVSAFFLAVGLWQRVVPVVTLALFISSLPWLFAWVNRRIHDGLALKRRMPAGQYENEPVPVELTIANRSAFPVFLPELTDAFPAERTQTREALHPGWVAPRGRLAARYTARATSGRGEYVIGPVTARITDPLGLSTETRTLEVTDSLTVFPTIFRVNHLPFESASVMYSAQLRSTSKAALGQDLYGVREYRRGDSPRRIHWFSSARRQRIIVKEFEMPTSKNVHIFLDFCEETSRGIGWRSTVDFAVRIAASIADFAIRSNHAVGLVAEAQIPIDLSPAAGLGHLARIMRLLVSARAVGKLPFDSLLLEHLARIKLDSAVILVFPTSRIDISRYLHAIGVLQGRRVNLTAVLIDDRAFYRVHGEMEDYEREIPIEAAVEQLLALGLTVYVVDADAHFTEAFERPRVASRGR